MIRIGNIVSFNDKATCDGAVWCRENNVSGKVVSIVDAYIIVDAMIGYGIYATEEQVDVISESGSLDQIDQHILSNAPLFEEGY